MAGTAPSAQERSASKTKILDSVGDEGECDGNKKSQRTKTKTQVGEVGPEMRGQGRVGRMI